MDNEQIIVKEKSNKGIILLLVIVIILLVSLIGLLVYNKFISKQATPSNTQNTQNNTQENTLKEVTDNTLIEKLRNELVVNEKRGNYEHITGLYNSGKISSSDSSNKYLIGFNIRKYVQENNITYSESNNTLYSVNKKDISNYMNKKYNTNINYSYTSSNSDDLLDRDYTNLVAYDNTYNIEVVGKAGSSEYLKTKLIKAAEDNNYLYIYDNAVICESDMGMTDCDNYAENTYMTGKSLIECKSSDGGNGDLIKNDTCPFDKMDTSLDNFISNLQDYALNNMSDKLKTFKHTFKKENNNYYWVSSEVVNNN